MAKLADARDLKSRDTRVSYRFDPGFRHHYIAEWSSPVARRAHNPKVMWFKSHLRNHIVKPKKISWLRTPEIVRFRGFSRVSSLFRNHEVCGYRVQKKRYHFKKTALDRI